MERISEKFRSWVPGHKKLKMASVNEVRLDAGFKVRNYVDLATKVAALSFFNPNLEMLFRGQAKDHVNQTKKASLLPSIFRSTGYLTAAMQNDRFSKLATAEREFCARISFKGSTRVKRYRVLQWAVIQHYEICPTPFLDLTHSLRVACTFSKMGHECDFTYVYVLGVPYLGGCISTSGDQGLQALRLTSVCPPGAHRPHFQEGYLVGEYPDASLEATEKYDKEEWDLGARLICKFMLPPSKEFWANGFEAIPKDSLYPPKDPFLEVATSVKGAITA